MSALTIWQGRLIIIFLLGLLSILIGSIMAWSSVETKNDADEFVAFILLTVMYGMLVFLAIFSTLFFISAFVHYFPLEAFK
jgi:ABC-type Na+ efflux pump permease subunit